MSEAFTWEAKQTSLRCGGCRTFISLEDMSDDTFKGMPVDPPDCPRCSYLPVWRNPVMKEWHYSPLGAINAHDEEEVQS